jgi:hypothetical protein
MSNYFHVCKTVCIKVKGMFYLVHLFQTLVRCLIRLLKMVIHKRQSERARQSFCEIFSNYWSHFTLCRHWIPAFLTNHQKNFDSEIRQAICPVPGWYRMPCTYMCIFLRRNISYFTLCTCILNLNWNNLFFVHNKKI